MSENLPAPLVPADLDVSTFPSYLLDVNRLRSSEIVVRVSGDAFRAAVLLWGAAWQQVPAGSLPDDDALLASYALLGRDLKAWRKIKSEALHGFIKCSDGRWYHPVVCEKAMAVQTRRQRTEKARQARQDNRNRGSQGDATERPTEAATESVGALDRVCPSAATGSVEGGKIREDKITKYKSSSSTVGDSVPRARATPPPNGADAPDDDDDDYVFGKAHSLAVAAWQAAGVDQAPTRADLAEAKGWVKLGYATEAVVETIRQVIERRDGKPPNALKYFTPELLKRASSNGYGPPKDDPPWVLHDGTVVPRDQFDAHIKLVFDTLDPLELSRAEMDELDIGHMTAAEAKALLDERWPAARAKKLARLR